MKKKWTTPQLIVLVRGEAGESVLVGCKGSEEGADKRGSRMLLIRCPHGVC